MAILTLTAQTVNGDPFITGNNINITTNSEITLEFTETDFQLFDPEPGETVSIDGGVTQLNYTFLGYGDVRNDPLQHAAFIRVEMPDGSFTTYAIDMNADGDQLPNLSTGNTKLQVATLSSGPSERFPAPACFTPGTLIDTAAGSRPVESLREGDLIRTLDDGLQPLRRIRRTTVSAEGPFAPVVFDIGAIRNERPLVVSPQHRMLVTGWRAELHYGCAEILVAARHLVNNRTIRVQEGGMVEYIHLEFDNHQIIFGNGVPSESFLPKRRETSQDTGPAKEFEALFPDDADTPAPAISLARPVMSGRQARVLYAA